MGNLSIDLEAEYLAICEALSDAMDEQGSSPAFSASWQRAQPAVTAAHKARQAWETEHADFLILRAARTRGAVTDEMRWK